MTRDGGRNPSSNAKPAIIVGGAILAIAAIYGLSQLVPKSSKAPAVVEPVKEIASDVKAPPAAGLTNGSTTGSTSGVTPGAPPLAGQPKTQAVVTPPPVSLTQGTTALLADKSGAGNAVPPVSTSQATPGSSPGGTPGGTPAASPGTTPSDSPTGIPAGITPAGSGPAGSGPSGATPATSPGAAPSTTPGTTESQPVALPTLSAVAQLIESGDRALSSGKPLEARTNWSKALVNPSASSSEQSVLRDRLSKLNEDLVFSPKVTPGDSLCEVYTVVSGDALVKIAKKRELATDWRLIQRINKMANPNSLRVGQKLKLVRGPFHAVVRKSDYRLDLFFGPPDEPEQWQYVRSWTVGLGEGNGTPVGTFIIKKGSKLENPPWANPRTGQKFDKDDPKNPIGEYWLGFQGVGSSAPLTGYGLHGTIDPASIGKQMSMGCVRMAADDIKAVYELLVDEVSVVRIVP
jgi:LysM repeat protein